MIFRNRQPITDQSVVSRKAGITATEFPDGVYLVDLLGGRLYQLNASGRAVWDGLSQPLSFSSLCGQLSSDFSADEATVRSDVLDLLDKLKIAKLVQIQNP